MTGPAPPRLVRPDYDGGSLPNLGVTVAAATGFRAAGAPPVVPPLRAGLDPFGGRRAEGPIVLLLVDGLGAGDLRRWAAGGGRFGPRWAEGGRTITTVFPSTTTAALTSLSTGVPPARHGLVGYRQYLPGFGVVGDMLKMSVAGLPGTEQLIGPDWRPDLLSGAPTLFRRGLRATALTRDRFKGTGFTRILYDGAEFVGYATATDLAHELLALLERPRPPAVVFAYWDELDTIHHLKGPASSFAALELDRLAGLFAHVAGRLSPARRRRTRLLVTGDHGQVPASVDGRIELQRHPELLALLDRPLSGDRRAGFLSVRRGRSLEVRRRLDDLLPPGSRVIGMERALRAGYFGGPPYHPEIRERLGDLLVLVPPPHGLTYVPPGQRPPTRHLFGAHGGMEAEEMQVPLLSRRFDDLDDGSGPPPAPRGVARPSRARR